MGRERGGSGEVQERWEFHDPQLETRLPPRLMIDVALADFQGNGLISELLFTSTLTRLASTHTNAVH